MATKEEHCHNASKDYVGGMTACESNRSVYGFEEYVIGDVKHEMSNMCTNTDSSLPEISDIKVEDGVVTTELKQEANECLEDEMVVNEDTTYANGIQLNNHIKDEKIELSCYPTASNSETELSFQIAEDIVHDEVKIEDQMVADNMNIKFENKFLSCDHCNEVYEDYCPKCRMLIYVLNGNALSDFDEGVAKEIPNGILEVRELPDHRGIYSLKHLPVGVKFGPFTGLRNTDCSWRIKGGKFIVSDDKFELLNWMQLINPAKSVLEHNLTVFVYEDNIYYRSVKEIQEGEELLVYFGYKYDVSLINDAEVDFIPTIETDAEDVYACTICCLGFKSSVYLTEHKIICVYGTEENSGNKDIKQCPNCKIYLEHWEYEQYHMPYCYDKDGRLCILSTTEGQMISSSSSNKQHELYSGDHKDNTSTVCFTNEQENAEAHVTDKHNGIARTEVIRCHMCQYETNCESQLKEHYCSYHFKDWTYKCSKCTYETKLESSLKNHIKTHETEKRFQCSKCDYVTNSKCYLKLHFTTHESVKRFKCEKCDYVTTVKMYLDRHSQIHETEKRFNCSKCEYITHTKRNLRQHFKTHETAMQFKCSQCNYATNVKRNLALHSRIHGTVKRFKCSKCDYATNVKETLEKHFDKHETVKRFNCIKCDYVTNAIRNLRKHANTHETLKRFKCSKCDYVTNVKFYLDRHLQTHEAMKRFKCSKCDYGTNFKVHIERHIQSHDTEKRFKCSKCDYATKVKGNLDKHSDIHETVKRFKCSNCDYITNTNRNLKGHIKIHETMKRFKCELCDYVTNASRNLRKHLKKHEII